MDLAARDAAENLRRADRLIEAHPGADLYLLPEMFTTGFDMEPDLCAEPAGGPAIQWMLAKSHATGAAICGSVATAVELFRYTNRMYFATPDGQTVVYDKRHLFSYSGEDQHYQAGDHRVVACWKGVRFLLEICYDLRFPVWSRCRDDYDVILYVANWPTKRQNAWDTLLRARAVENQAWVVGANRVGQDQMDLSYSGGTAVINAYGHTVAAAPDNQEAVIMADIDIDALAQYRTKFPSLCDSDTYIIKGIDE